METTKPITHKWYALKVTANQERKVKEYIDKKIRIERLDAWITRVVVPVEKYQSIDIKGKKSMREKLILPGYLLIEADLTHGEVSPMLQDVSGVYGFLSLTEGKVSSRPAPLSQREVDRFLQVYENQEELTWEFAVGDNVKILEGAFAEMKGAIVSIDQPRKQAFVLVSIFGRETKVDVSLNNVEKSSVKTPTKELHD